MRRWLAIVFCLLASVAALNAHAQRAFSQAELDAMLAPVALYPDPLLTNILNAAIYPDDVQAAAAWSRANPNLAGDDALRAVESELWPPSVKALVVYPDVLARMAESPWWVADLGEAYQYSYPALAATIQQLRARAQSKGYLRSDDQQQVYRQNDQIYVQPVYPTLGYAPYYNPYVVYGTWWWPAAAPVFWRPWHARPIFVTKIVQRTRFVHPPHVVHRPAPRTTVTPWRHVPEAQRAPIVQGGPVVRHAPVMHTGPVVHTGPVMQTAPRTGTAGHAAHGGSWRGNARR